MKFKDKAAKWGAEIQILEEKRATVTLFYSQTSGIGMVEVAGGGGWQK